MRWVWIDCFEEFHSRSRARAVKLVSMAEDHIYEQYPDFPIMPNSLIIEGLAQTGGILVGEANDFKEKVVLAKLPTIKFERFAVPGDRLDYIAELVDLKSEGAVVSGKVLCNGEPMAEAEIMYAHLDQAREDPTGAKNFVFTKDHLINILKLADGSYGKPKSNGAGQTEGASQ
jgi:3-hydroxymyristoyl/3-hydroxydecanoyl-(acyl carrier protein) dehydratases